MCACFSIGLVITIVLLYTLAQRSPSGDRKRADGHAIEPNTTTTDPTVTAFLSVPADGEQVAIGSVLTSMSTEYAPCTDAWQYVCGPSFAEEPRLSVRQRQVDEILHRVLQTAEYPIPQVYRACQASESIKVHASSSADIWGVGYGIDDVYVSATANSFERHKPIRMFLTTSQQRRGASVFAAYDVMDCGSELDAVQAQFAPIPNIYDLFDGPVFSDFPDAVCAKLKTVNMTRPKTLTISMSADRCLHTVADMYAPLIADTFSTALNVDPAPITHLFATLRSTLISKLPAAWPARFGAKLQNLHLSVGPESFEGPLPPHWNQNFSSFYLDHLRAQWLHESRFGVAKTYMYPWDVNAVYNSDTNTVTIPLAMETLWAPKLPSEWYDATVGFVVAHEMSHSIDPFGIQFDEIGFYDPIPHPSGYLDFTKCLKTDAAAAGLYPNQTLGEMFADRVGMELTSTLLGNSAPRSVMLFGNQASTTLQMAFILFVRTWCRSPQYSRGSRLNATIEHDPHPPNRFRVLETLRGLPRFNDAFGCSHAGCGSLFD